MRPLLFEITYRVDSAAIPDQRALCEMWVVKLYLPTKAFQKADLLVEIC